jgi:hypothetical protein
MSSTKSVIIPQKLGINQKLIGTGLVLGGPFVISGSNHLSVVVEGVGGTNVILVKAKIANQAAFTTIETITGTSAGTDVDVSLYDLVEFDCTVYDPSGTPKLVVSSFFKSASGSGGGVTSLNTLTGAVTLAAGTNITLTPVGNTITIDASGGATPGGSDTQIQFNDSGSFGGDADLTWDKTLNILTITGDAHITGKLTVDGPIDPTYIEYTQIVTPSNPAATKNRTYFKSDDKFYGLDSAGTEVLIGPAASPPTPNLDAVLTAGRDVDATGTINTSSSIASIDVNARKLYGSDGTTVMAEFGAANFYTPNGLDTDLIRDFTTHNGSISVNSRNLIKSDGSTVTVDWQNQELKDTSSILSANWSTRNIYGSDGTTVMLNWSGPADGVHVLQLVTAPASPTLGSIYFDTTLNQFGAYNGTTWDYLGGGAAPTLAAVLASGRDVDATGTINDSTSVLSINVNTRVLYDVSGTVMAFDWANRELRFDDGSIFLDYGSQNPVEMTFQYLKLYGTDMALDCTISSKAATTPIKQIDINTGKLSENSLTSVDWTGRVLYDTDGTTAILSWGLGGYGSASVMQMNQLKDGTGVMSVQVVDHQLFDKLGVLSLDYDQRKFYDTDGTTLLMTASGGYVFGNDFRMNFLYDGSNVLSVKPVDRTLYASDGTTVVLDWSDPLLTKIPVLYTPYIGNLSNGSNIQVNSSLLQDTSLTTSQNWNARHLVASDGTTVVVDWSDPLLTKIPVLYTPYIGNLSNSSNIQVNSSLLQDTSAATSQNWNTRLLIASDGTTTVADWTNATTFGLYLPIGFHTSSLRFTAAGVFSDGSAKDSIDVVNRTATASDGTTVQLDWSTAGTVDAGTNTVEMAGFKLTTSPTSGYVLTSDAAGVGTWQAAAGGGGSLTLVETAVDYTVLNGDHIIGVTDTTVARTITLVDNTTAGSGYLLNVKDQSGGAGTNNITVTAGGADTIDGAASIVISVNYGALKLYGNGAGGWFTL